MAVMDKKRKPKRLKATKEPKAPAIDWAKRLRDLRYKMGDPPQGELADRINVSQSIWSAWERGEKIPSAAMQLLIRLVFKDHF